MQLNIDSAIFIGFLIVTIVAGLMSGRGISTIKEYAVGNRNFSTATIAATLAATWMGGGFFNLGITKTYSDGLYFIWSATLGDITVMLLIGYLFAHRLGEFLGTLSIAEAMGGLYGKKVRVITSLAGFIGTSGGVAIQLKVSGMLFEYCLGVSSIYGVFISGTIITMYSALGGIKSVTFTDVIQLLTFGTILPSLAFFILGTLDNISVLTNTITTSELFNYTNIFDFSEPKAVYYIFFFLFGAIPGFRPAIFQRIAMAKNTTQVRRSFIIAGFTCFFIGLTVAWIGVVLLAIEPGLNPKDLLKHILFDYSYTGLKGLTLAGIMAMAMSTADSYINAAAVLLVHDFCKPIGLKIKSELTASRIASTLIGIFAMVLAIRSGDLLKLVITAASFYMPIVTVPFIMSTFGFRSSGKSVLIGMGAGFAVVLLWDIILKIEYIDGLIPAMFANLIFLIGSHYILRQPGGWVGIKDEAPLRQARQERQAKLYELKSSIVNFNFSAFLRKNSLASEGMYTFFGLFCIISIYSTMHTIPNELKLQYPKIIDFTYPTVLLMATILISYPLWLPQWKEKNIISIFWNISVFYILICVGFILVIMSNFAHLQLMAFMVNLIVIAVLVKWQWALIMVITGILLTTQFFKLYVGVDSLPQNLSSIQFESAYLLLLVSSILIIFLKPKQEYQALTEEKNEHLNGRISNQEKELQKALSLKSEFIRNISHEYHAPMTGVMSTSETMWETYDKLSDKQRRQAAYDIFTSSLRLKAFDDNISTLSKLSNIGYELKLAPISLSDLLYERIQICRKLYEENKESREFILNIEEGIIINGDSSYLTQALDNLIINTITYCQKGKITIALIQTNNEIHLNIIDEGIGVPPNELFTIFDEFTVSSKTRTPAGGRGIGLAVVKKVIEAHDGSIKAESDGHSGTTFRIVLPH